MRSLISRSRDPFWDDGRGARRARTLQKIGRTAFALTALTLVALVVANLPPIDPAILTKPEARPVLGGAALALLGSMILLALARIRRADIS